MSKIKDLKKANPEFIINIVDILSENDPTKTNKYLPFMVNKTKDWVNWFIDELRNETFSEMFEIISSFDELCEKNLIDNKDIYSYETTEDIIEAIKEGKEKVTISQVKKYETKILYEDDRYYVLMPLSARSSNIYGKTTKWCVSTTDEMNHHFINYTKKGRLVFFIDKSYKTISQIKANRYSKIAFHKYYDDKLTIWDCPDEQLSAEEVMEVYELIPKNIMEIILKAINGPANSELKQSQN